MYNAMFVGWGAPVRGREQQAAKVFGEWVEMLGKWQSTGAIKSFAPVFIQPNQSTLGGFFLVNGEEAKLTQLMNSEETRKAQTRAQLIVDNFTVMHALTGDEVGKQMQLFTSNANEIAKP